jgi:TonB family protein
MKSILIIALLALASCSSRTPIKKETTHPENGYVKFIFDVSESGRPLNPRIVDSYPPGKFDEMAMEAIYKLTFKPKIVNGEAVVLKNMKYTMEFKLDKP